MLQSGLLGDETGTVKFVIWKEQGKEKPVVGSVYSIFYAQVDEFNERLSLNITGATIMQEEGDIATATGGDAEIRGAIVHVAPGSGIIKRCPVEGCNRALSRQNYCPIHEIQPKFVYDLRIKGWLDDGEKTHNLLLKRDVVEALTGINLDQAKEIAENNPLGMDEVFLQMREKVLGRYVTCKGREIENRLLVNTCERMHFESGEHAKLLNRAGVTMSTAAPEMGRRDGSFEREPARRVFAANSGSAGTSSRSAKTRRAPRSCSCPPESVATGSSLPAR